MEITGRILVEAATFIGTFVAFLWAVVWSLRVTSTPSAAAVLICFFACVLVAIFDILWVLWN